MKKIFALALAAFALTSTPAFAQANAADAAYIERAWADNQLSAAERAEIAQIERRGAIATAADLATTKITPAMRGGVYGGSLGTLDQRQLPWREATVAQWNQLFTELPRNNYSLAATTDYDGDGKADQARIYTNGKQTAVLALLSTMPSRPQVIYKTDGVQAGSEIYAAGPRRFYLSIRDRSPIILFMEKGKAATAHLGD